MQRGTGRARGAAGRAGGLLGSGRSGAGAPGQGAPIDGSSAQKKKGGSSGNGNSWLAATLGEIVTAAARTDTFLGERYHRIARRRGKRRAMVAVGNSVLTIIWNLLSDPGARYHDLRAGFYQSRLGKQRYERDLIRRLDNLTGKAVTLQPRPGEQPAA